MRATDGDLLERISLELAERPKIENRPDVKSGATSKRLSVSFAKGQFGKPSTTFSSDTPQIYVRWQGQTLTKGRKGEKRCGSRRTSAKIFHKITRWTKLQRLSKVKNARGAFTLARFRIHGVSPDFIGQLQKLGYAHPEPDQLIAMRIHGVTPDFISGLQSRGMKNLSIDQLVSLRIHGID